MKNLFAIITLSVLVTNSHFSEAQSYITEKNNPKFKVKSLVELNAFGFNLRDVKLLDGSPFKNAMDKDAAYLLTIEPNRLLHRFHINAGLPVKGEVYGGWESEGLSGHTLGHYLSACAMFYANTGNIAFKKNVDYIVDELERCQIARKTGYIGAIPNEDSIFFKVSKGIIKSSGFDLNGGWSPWYTVHKIMAGLVDAYYYCDNEKALKVVQGMANWIDVTIRNLTEDQRLKMLNCEYGGMQDVLVSIYSLTGENKYLNLSYKFDDEFVMGQLKNKIDPMPGKHSNTNVPKAIGAARRYVYTKSESDKTIASFFWDIMVHHHSYVIGGNSNYEYCGEPDKLNDNLSDNTCETCNTYNMLKLTRHLFCLNPNSEFIDYYERALYNHILASQNPINGMMCYFVPLRMGTTKQFSDQFNTFTCCVGSGMENHSKYAETIFFESKDEGLYINLFIPSELTWKSKNAVVKMETSFPLSDEVRITINLKTPKQFPLYIRNPKWTNNRMQIKVNDLKVEAIQSKNGYSIINRKWANDDKVEFRLPMTLYSESMPDNLNRIAFLFGPIVLAGQLGDSIPDPVYGTPVLLTNNKNINDWLKPVKDCPLTFKMEGIGKPFDVTLAPFYKTYNNYYSVYFDYFTSSDWVARQTEYETEKKRQKEIEEQTIDYFRIGEMQPERDHNLIASEKSYVDIALGRTGREARNNNFFAFEMKVDPNAKNALLLTYIGDDKNRKFDLLVDGIKIAFVDWVGGATGKFYDKSYSIPDELVKNKSKITVRIEANYERTAGRVFGCRTTRIK